MKLFQLPYSHFSAKARIVILEKNVQVELPEIPGGSPDSEEYRQINPSGLVPCLVHDDWVISESEVIVEYLDEVFPEVPMLPDHARTRARSRWLSRTHDLRVAPRLSELYALTLSDTPREQQARVALADLHDQLSLVETSIDPNPYFFGEQFGISDASFVLSFWYATSLSAHFGNALTQDTHPKLFAWFEQAQKRQSVTTVLNDCQQALGINDANAAA